MDEASTEVEQTNARRQSNASSSSSSSASAAATASAGDVVPATQPPSYGDATKEAKDEEAGITSDDVNVITASPSAAAAQCTDNAFSDRKVRLAFIRKVYLILMSQLTFTVICICIFLFSSTIKEWVRYNLWLYLSAYGVFIVTYVILVCCPKVRRRVPANYICLIVFTIAVSILTAIISSFHDTVIVLVAMGMTAAICLSITIFTIQTKIDFTMCYGLLFAFCMVIIFCCVTLFIFFLAGFYYYLNVLYSGIIAMIFALFLVFDTMQVVGGHGLQLSPEEYITGALELYIDIIYIFLAILGASKSN